MTTNTIITNTEYNSGTLRQKTGTLMFPDELYDVIHFCDITKIRKNLGERIPKGKRILAVLVHTTASPHFKNELNMDIIYKIPVFAYEDLSYNPVGDVIIVVSD